MKETISIGRFKETIEYNIENPKLFKIEDFEYYAVLIGTIFWVTGLTTVVIFREHLMTDRINSIGEILFSYGTGLLIIAFIIGVCSGYIVSCFKPRFVTWCNKRAERKIFKELRTQTIYELSKKIGE